MIDRRRLTVQDILKIASVVGSIIIGLLVAFQSYVRSQDTLMVVKESLNKHVEIATEINEDHEKRLIILEQTMKSIDRRLESIDHKLGNR